MPLLPGSGRDVISHNIREMIRAGHPQDQAVAASLSHARMHRTEGGSVDALAQRANQPLTPEDLTAPTHAPGDPATEGFISPDDGFHPRYWVNRALSSAGVPGNDPTQRLQDAAGLASGMEGMTAAAPAIGRGLAVEGAAARDANMARLLGADRNDAAGNAVGRLMPNDYDVAPSRGTGLKWPAFRDMNEAIRSGEAPGAGKPIGGDEQSYLDALLRQSRSYVKPVEGRAAGGLAPLPQMPWFAKSEARAEGHVGPINSSVAGRTDHLPISVPSGSHVIPADVVSGLGEGNTNHGSQVLAHMFKTGPYGSPLPHMNAHPMRPPPMHFMSPPKSTFADGGSTDGKGVDIMAAGGEFVVPPDVVKDLGHGDEELGHRILDHWIVATRKKTIGEMKKLPPPVKE